MKSMSSSDHIEYKVFIEVSCANTIHTGEKGFCSCHFERLVGRSFSENERKRVLYLVCSSLFCISRGKKTKKTLLVRDIFSLLRAYIWFDVTKCKFIVKNSSFKMLVVFSLIFVADTKINSFIIL